MWIQVRTMDGKTNHRINDLSKLTKIEELRKLLVDKFDIPTNKQRLFYRGKQLEDGYTLYDYDVRLNDIVQILAKQVDSKSDLDHSQCSTPEKEETVNEETTVDKQLADCTQERERTVLSSIENNSISQYFKIGDLVDAKDLTYGAWFEAKVIAILSRSKTDNQTFHSISDQNDENIEIARNENPETERDDGLLYKVVFEDHEDSEDPVELSLQSIRPRAQRLIEFSEIQIGDMVMVNYNVDEPSKRGFWYDCTVTGKKSSRNKDQLIVTIIMGPNQVKLQDCRVKFIDEVYAIEKSTHAIQSKSGLNTSVTVMRQKPPKCSHCNDNPSRKCKECSCHICGGKDSPEKQIMCDECDLPYHIWCLDPPLSEIPNDDWYCPECKNDENEVVKAGEKLKASKKKSKMASASSSTTRDWGKGMACVGRTKECTLVPSNHFGPIPGVEVGTMWKYRVQVAECGVHRPQVAGIHGREAEGAFSIVLSGGYEDDLDNGDEFLYTGSGGRDLSGNKRCAAQSCDQTLTRMNKALAMNCNAPLTDKGAESKDWKGGKAVRVVRNFKGRKHSNYSPEEGNRYDGIYKVVKYWPETGKSGFLVWRYSLRRDDPAPAPWTKAGKKRIEELGLEMQFPEGYLEFDENEQISSSSKKRNKRGNSDDEACTPKRKKKAFQLPKEVLNLIKSDSMNKKLWDECMTSVSKGQQDFLKKVEQVFQCICCQDVVIQPVTTSCSHNICKECLIRSFSAKVYNCPMCRQPLEKEISETGLNSSLQTILNSLFPGYGTQR